MNNELNCRYQLHEHRYKRVEYDIHNVRATELTLHSERVSKQSKAMENALTNIMNDYLSFSNENKANQAAFKEKLISDIEQYLKVNSCSRLAKIYFEIINIKS